MDKILIAPAFLRLLREGHFFRPVFRWILRVQAMLAGLGGILLSIELWKRASGSSTGTIFGLLVLQLALAAAVYLAGHLSWLRAEELGAMEDKDADALSVARLLIRLGGEIYAGVLTPLSLGGALLTWISAGDSGGALRGLFGPLLPEAGGEAFQAGLTLLATGLAMAACALLGAYAVAELIRLFVALERNTRKG